MMDQARPLMRLMQLLIVRQWNSQSVITAGVVGWPGIKMCAQVAKGTCTAAGQLNNNDEFPHTFQLRFTQRSISRGLQ